MTSRSLFIVVSADRSLRLGPAAAIGAEFRLGDGSFLVLSELTQSRVYHCVKDRAAPGSALFVGELAAQPKFKGQAAGALKWTRKAVATTASQADTDKPPLDQP